MKDLKNLSVGIILAVSTFSMGANAVVIQGSFTGNVIDTTDCSSATSQPCTPLWNGSPQGTVASGSFSYDTALAPHDLSPSQDLGYYFSYTNTWLTMTLNIGGTTFDISDSAIPSKEPPGDVESVLISDNLAAIPVGFERQSFFMTDKTTATQENGDYIAKSLNVALETFDLPIIQGDSLIQEYKWVDNGNLLQGSGSFDFKSASEGQIQDATAYIRFTDFSMKIKNETSVPEPSSISLVLFALLPLVMKKKRVKDRI